MCILSAWIFVDSTFVVV